MKTLKNYSINGKHLPSFLDIAEITKGQDPVLLLFYLELDVPSINAYTGEFMTQYSWAEFVAGYLDRITSGRSAMPD